jgi:hypothetical protein
MGKINRVVARQITEDEKLIIATLQPTFSALNIQNGVYSHPDLVKLVAQNVTSFTKKYTPTDHPRIMRYLSARSKRQVIMPTFHNPLVNGSQRPSKKLKVQPTKQRGWVYLQETATGLVSPRPFQSDKGKGKSKGKGKPQGKGKGKGKPKGKGKGDKGKGVSKGKGKSTPKGNTTTGASPFQQKPGEMSHGHLKCHFCHTIGHIKPNCRKWLALQTSEQYKQRNSHEPKYQLIYDHLEDSVLAPRLCRYCTDSYCDGENCASPFDPIDYDEASIFFTQNLSALVVDAKLERPLDSHAPQTEQTYAYEYDDWGEIYEDEYDGQWEESDKQEQYEDSQDNYNAEVEYEYDDEEKDSPRSDDYDEDDQDRFM